MVTEAEYRDLIEDRETLEAVRKRVGRYISSCSTGFASKLAFRRFLTGLQDAIIAISWDLRAFLGRPEFLREPMAHVNGT